MAIIEAPKSEPGRLVREQRGEAWGILDTWTGEFTVFWHGDPLVLDLDPDIDLTKPVWEQVERKRRREQRAGKAKTAIDAA